MLMLMLSRLNTLIVAGGLVPYGVGDRIGLIRDPGDGLGQRQRSALGVADEGRVSPALHRGEALV